MSTNPISILQEYLQKNNNPLPKYDMVSTSLANHSFTFRVSCDVKKQPYTALGEANSKQIAKHRSAENMIILLNQNNCGIKYGHSEESFSTPERKSLGSTGSPSSNCSSDYSREFNPIGALQEICVKNKYVLPSYSEGSYAQGHSNFKMTCTLGTYKVEGASNGKKKQAKYECARKMYDELKNMSEDEKKKYKIVGDSSEMQVVNANDSNSKNTSACNSRELSIDSPASTQHAIEKALSLFPKLTKSHSIMSDPKKIKLSNYHSYLKSSLDQIQQRNFFEFYQTLDLQKIKNDIDKLSIVLDKICTILNIEKEEALVKTSDNKNYGVVIKLKTTPEFSDVGIGSNAREARLSALYRIIRTIFYLLM
ncbi:uncharacterized protein LOC130669950 [Microplitis mediator]|uniref:uncharacterized protein LOC130669950 n=1 Tax=Microplitis mediator TaxID=375433 RepID=UPI00255465BC|nr:uncharacterized protein LOC130669950 [Microplitis mediator]XP_057329097.1 uncharacterized protein LOC130669950 [Microplitis mediator]